MIFLPKSPNAPVSLLSKTRYDGDDVLEQLMIDFFGKCYICEENDKNIAVEHFLPKHDYSNLEYERDNLFLGCSFCNSIKLNHNIYIPILDCTKEEDNVEKYIYKKYGSEDGELRTNIVITGNTDGVSDYALLDKIRKTVLLCDNCYHGINKTLTANKGKGSINLRRNIEKEVRYFNNLLKKYGENKTSENKDEIINLLSKNSEFTSFKRRIIRDNIDKYPEFADDVGWIKSS